MSHSNGFLQLEWDFLVLCFKRKCVSVCMTQVGKSSHIFVYVCNKVASRQSDFVDFLQMGKNCKFIVTSFPLHVSSVLMLTLNCKVYRCYGT